jgi:hypothetical protein
MRRLLALIGGFLIFSHPIPEPDPLGVLAIMGVICASNALRVPNLTLCIN